MQLQSAMSDQSKNPVLQDDHLAKLKANKPQKFSNTSNEILIKIYRRLGYLIKLIEKKNGH